VISGIDDIWMVSLDRRADRWASWKTATPPLASLTNRLPAVDGKLLELTQNLYTFFENNNFNWKKSVTGCALSHILLWAQLASEQPFVKNYLILEDDQRFIGTEWQQQLATAMETAPTDAELLYLGGVLPGNLSFYSSCLNPVNNLWATIKPNSYFTGNKVLVPVFHFCTYAYVLTRVGAQKLCQTLAQNGCHTSIDHYLMGAGLKTYVLRDLLATCYQIDDPKYKESEFDNFDRIDQFDSDIWNNTDCFVDEGDFVKNLEYPPLYQVVVDVLTQAPHSIQTVNTIRPDLGIKQPIGNSKIVYYFNRTDGHPHDGTLEEGWLRTLWPDFTFRSIAEPFVPGSWILAARPNMDFWSKKAFELDEKGVPFQILHLSDEFVEGPMDLYRLGCCRQVVRNYWRPDCATLSKVITIPLGFARGVSKNKVMRGLLKDRPYVWSFHGTDWYNRKRMLEPLMNVIPHNCKWLSEFMDAATMTPAKEYHTLLSETQFVPVPPGNNPETYRLYEALENGCIPVYVRSEGDDVFWTWICRWLPLHPLASWTEAVAWMNTVDQEDYRRRLLDAWESWKTIAKLAFQL
jgi:GR25 family glycosyltransferase involved in LPS biosynthesis